MAVLGTPARDRSAVVTVAAVGVIVLALLAARADARAVGGSPPLTVLDLAVGFAFVLASIPATGALHERLLVGAVGIAWFAGSVFTFARSLHQGVLAVALLAFPAGRLAGVPRQLLGIGSVAVAFGVVPQPGVAALFAAVTVVAFATGGSNRPVAVYPAAAAAAVAAVLVFSWWAVRRSAIVSPLVLYEAILIAVAIGFPPAMRAVARSRARLADRVLGDARVAGLPGLQLVLAGVLDDPDLRIDLWDADAGTYVDFAGGVCQATPSADGLSVFDGDHLLARVITTSPAVADQPTAYAVIAAVRLAVVNRRLHDQQAQRVADVEASRARLLAAADRERERVAARLRTEAGASLERARAKLAAARTEGDPELSGRIEFASSEVAAAATEVQRIVAGVPPTALGAGSLHGAIAALAARSPAKVTLNLADDAAADTAAETTLFYVCSEALANASKHAGATHVVIDLQRHDDRLLLSVHDDGQGGADTAGSGLQGLADRLAAAGGHLTIDSPPGGGTTVTAAVPQRS
jgi:signal transduction histidine kinase